MDEIKVYHRAPERRRILRARWVATYLGLIAIYGAGIGGLLLQSSSPGRPAVWAPMALLSVFVSAWMVRSALRLVDRLMTYQLTLGPNVLRIACQGLVPTELLRQDCTRIVEVSLGLRLYAGRTLLGVPRDIGGYDEVRARLAEWRPIERSRLGLLWRVIIFGQLGLWIGSCLSMSAAARTAMLAGVVVAAAVIAIFCARTVMTTRAKAQLYAVELIIGLWALARIYFAWSGS